MAHPIHAMTNASTPKSERTFWTTIEAENREYLRQFIQTYRQLPVLWDASLRDYSNRDKRAEAYERLLPVFRRLKRDGTLEDVKKKINTLRTNYRKELRLIEYSKRFGGANLHQPRCWTFNDLDFLRSSEKFNPPSPTGVGGLMLSKRSQSPPLTFQCSGVPPGTQEAPLTIPDLTECQPYKSSYSPFSNQKRMRLSSDNIPEEFLSSYGEEESVARGWTFKLKRMQRDQRLLAEKFINEILFEGEWGTLHRGSVHINPFEPFVRFENPEIVSNSNLPPPQEAQEDIKSAHTEFSYNNN